MLGHSNLNWPIPSHTLHLRYFDRILISHPHLPRRKLRVTNPKYPRQRSIIFLHLHLYTYCPRPILRIIPLQRNLKYWCNSPTIGNNDGVRRLRPSMGPNIFLRCHSNYKPSIRRTIHGRYISSMNLRRILSRQRHTHAILRISFPTTICYRCCNHPTPTFPSRNGIK